MEAEAQEDVKIVVKDDGSAPKRLFISLLKNLDCIEELTFDLLIVKGPISPLPLPLHMSPTSASTVQIHKRETSHSTT